MFRGAWDKDEPGACAALNFPSSCAPATPPLSLNPMIIQRTGPRTVEGLGGFEVEEGFPYYLEYRQGGRVMRIAAELAAGPGASIILFDETRSARWQAPHQNDPLDAAAMHQILVRVTAAVLLLGIQPIWQALPPEAERTDWPVIWAEADALLRRAD